VEITFHQVPPCEHHYPDTTLILEVGVKPTTRLDDAVLNFRFPREGLGHAGLLARNARGDKLADGSILPPRDLDSNSPILWWEASTDLRAASTMFWFQLIPMNSKQAQTFKVTMLVSSEKLHGREHQAEYEVSYSPPPQQLSGERDGA